MPHSFDQTGLYRIATNILNSDRPLGRNVAYTMLKGQLGPYDDGRVLRMAVDRYFGSAAGDESTQCPRS